MGTEGPRASTCTAPAFPSCFLLFSCGSKGSCMAMVAVTSVYSEQAASQREELSAITPHSFISVALYPPLAPTHAHPRAPAQAAHFNAPFSCVHYIHHRALFRFESGTVSLLTIPLLNLIARTRIALTAAAVIH